MKNNQKGFSGLVLIGVVALIIAIGATIFLYPKKQVSKNDISSCGNLTDSFAKDQCYYGMAINNSDDSYCTKIKDINGCYQQVAIAKKDISICDKMVDSDLKNELKGACYLQIAEALKDTTICDRLTFFPSYQSVCYSKIGTANNDSSICEKITNIQGANGCYSSLASKNADVSLCNKIAPSEDKDLCIMNVSIAKKDLVLCQQIATLKYQQACYQSITGKSPTSSTSQNSASCDGITSPTDQYNCYVKTAETTKTPTVCNKMQSQDFRDNCYIKIAKDTKNPQLCAQAVAQKNKNICYYDLASLINSSKWCEKIINNEGTKNGCLLTFQVNQISQPSLNVTMDLAMATLTGQPGQIAKVTGTIKNNSSDIIYLNSMGGSLSSPDLDFDMTDLLSVIPRSFKPGDTYQGSLFGIKVGPNAEKQKSYSVNFYFIGGETDSDSQELTNQNLSITIN